MARNVSAIARPTCTNWWRPEIRHRDRDRDQGCPGRRSPAMSQSQHPGGGTDDLAGQRANEHSDAGDFNVGRAVRLLGMAHLHRLLRLQRVAGAANRRSHILSGRNRSRRRCLVRGVVSTILRGSLSLLRDRFISARGIPSRGRLGGRSHVPFDHLNPAPNQRSGNPFGARNRIESPGRWVQQQFEHGDRHCLAATLAVARNKESFCASNTGERRLTRMLAEQLPSESSWQARFEPVSARRRLMPFNEDCPAQHADAIALIDRTIRHQVCRVFAFVWV
jgi:hypothetical protein